MSECDVRPVDGVLAHVRWNAFRSRVCRLLASGDLHPPDVRRVDRFLATLERRNPDWRLAMKEHCGKSEYTARILHRALRIISPDFPYIPALRAFSRELRRSARKAAVARRQHLVRSVSLSQDEFPAHILSGVLALSTRPKRQARKYSGYPDFGVGRSRARGWT